MYTGSRLDLAGGFTLVEPSDFSFEPGQEQMGTALVLPLFLGSGLSLYNFAGVSLLTKLFFRLLPVVRARWVGNVSRVYYRRRNEGGSRASTCTAGDHQ